MNQQTSITCGEHITPSQLALHEAARARAMRKIEAARRNAKAHRPPLVIAPVIPPAPIKVEEPKPLIPPFFFTSLSRKVMWDGEYCPHSGGSVELLRNRGITEIAMEWLKRFEGVTLKDIKGSSRMVHFVFPRQVIALMVKKERPDLSLPQIGRWMGGRDHTTILHGNNKIQTMIDEGTFDAAMAQWQANARGTK